MKKTITVFLAFIIVLSFGACAVLDNATELVEDIAENEIEEIIEEAPFVENWVISIRMLKLQRQ